MRRTPQLTARRWLRRALFWVALPAATLLGFRLYWGSHAQRRLDASLARLQAMHVRLTPEQYDQTLPSADNAVEPLLAGLTHFKVSAADSKLIHDPLEHQSAQDQNALLQLLAVHQGLLDGIDAAATRPAAEWSPGARERSVPYADLYLLLDKAARIAAERHEETSALRQLSRVLACARIFEKSPSSSHQAIAMLYQRAAAETIERIQSGLALKDPSASAEARHLIAALRDDAGLLSGLALGTEGSILEARTYSGEFTRLSLSSSSRDDAGWPLRPLAMEDWARLLDLYAKILAAERAPNWQQYLLLEAHIPGPSPRRDRLQTMLQLYEIRPAAGPGLQTPYATWLEAQSRGRAAALLLAARLYAAEHGALPKDLDQLKDLCGGQLPADPFAEGQPPLHYRLDPAGPTVWSVGRDGLDDHADKNHDLVYGAANPPPVPPPAPPPPPAPATRRPLTTMR